MRRLVIVIGSICLLLVLIVAGGLYWFLSGDGVRTALERQATTWLGQPVQIGSARAQFLPRPALALEDVTVGDPARLTLGAVEISTELRGLLRRRIENATIRIAQSRIDMPLSLILPRPAGTPADSSGAGATESAPVELVSIRSIVLDDIVLASRGREIRVSGESALLGTTLQIPTFSATAGGTALTAEGTVELGERLDARLRVRADRLDLDELLALAGAFTPPPGSTVASPSTAPPILIAARLSAETATVGGLEIAQFATDFQLDGAAVSMAPLTLQVFGGRYQGSLYLTLGELMGVTLRSRIIDLDVSRLSAFGGFDGAVTGTLTGAGTFTGEGADLAAVLTAAHGEGTATIDAGTVQHLNLVRTVVLFFGRPAPDASPGSDAFDRMDIRFSLNDRVLTGDAVAFHSPDADVVGAGTLALDSKALDGQFDLSLSEELSAQAGTDLARFTREGNRIVLPANLGGTLGSPRLTIDAAAAVQRGLRNEIERRMKGLLDRFQ